jgi:aspartate kinase
MKVLKFGGTSVGSAQRIRKVAQLLPEAEPCIVVLSAMAGTTNTLIDITNQCSDGNINLALEIAKRLEAKYMQTSIELFETEVFRNRGMKFTGDLFAELYRKLSCQPTKQIALEIAALGEQLSTGLFHLYLTESGIRSTYIPALDFMRIDKEREPDYFYISQNLERLIKASSYTPVFITEGYICRNAAGQTDNLGRGGSDYTAAIIGYVTDSDEVQIWTDIDGLRNNDPRHVGNTKPIRHLSYGEAAELAYFGAKILHPSTIQPCREKNIPVVLKNTLQPEDSGTLIDSVYIPKGIKAVAAKNGITAITIRSSKMLLAYGFLSRVFEVFNRYKTPVDMIATSEVSISLTIDDCSNLQNIASELAEFSTVECAYDQTIVCIVGDFGANRKGYAARIFNALQEIPIRIISYGGSSNSISILVDSQSMTRTLQLLQEVVDADVEVNLEQAMDTISF